jgi:hypothetical protein
VLPFVEKRHFKKYVTYSALMDRHQPFYCSITLCKVGNRVCLFFIVQTSYGAHQRFYSIGTSSCFHWGKAARDVQRLKRAQLYLHFHLILEKRTTLSLTFTVILKNVFKNIIKPLSLNQSQ